MRQAVMHRAILPWIIDAAPTSSQSAEFKAPMALHRSPMRMRAVADPDRWTLQSHDPPHVAASVSHARVLTCLLTGLIALAVGVLFSKT